MSSIWELFVRVSGDNSAFKKSMKDSESDLLHFGDFARDIGTKLVGFLAFGKIAEGAFRAADAFEKAGIQIQRTTGATGEKLEGLEGSFKKLFIGNEQSAEMIATALTKIAQKTGATGTALEKLTESALQFAEITGTDLAASVANNQRVFDSWGISIERQVGALDQMYVATQKTGIGADKLGQSLLSMGPALRNLGFGFTESVALIGSFEKAGLNAEEMVMGLNKVFAEFAAKGKEPKQALADLIEKMTATTSRVDALNLAIGAGFVARTAGKFVDAVKSGAFQLSDLVTQLQASSGAVAEMENKTETLGDAFAKLGHVIVVTIAGPGSGWLHWLTEVINKFNEAKVGSDEFMRAMASQGNGSRFAGSGITLAEAQSGRKNTSFTAADLSGTGLGATPTGVLGGTDGGGAGAPGVTPATLNFKTMAGAMSLESARMLNTEFQTTVKTVTEWYLGLKKIDLLLPTMRAEFSQVGLTGATVAQGVNVAAKSFDEALSPSIKKSEALMHALGLTSTRELRAQYDAAMKSTEAMILLGASEADVEAAATSTAEAHKKLAERMGEWDGQAKVATKTGVDFGRQVSTVLTDLSRSLADVVMGTKSFGSAFAEVGKAIVRIIIEDIITGAIGQLTKALAGVMANLGGVAGALGKVFGGGASVAGGVASVAGGVASAGGGVAGAAGGASKVAGAASAGPIGIVTGIISAVSDVVSNLQFAAMNKSLDLIENYTRYLKIGVVEQGDSLLSDSHIIRNTLTDLMRFNWDVVAMYLQGMSINLDVLSGKGGAGGKGGFTWNNCSFTGSPNEIANAIFTQASLAGAL